ncbi:MAG: preprotein translocase subunit SecY, partial [Fimbriimonadaceae bacterium]
TVDFLNGVITRLTTVGAAFLAFVALSVYLVPLLTQINTGLGSLLLGTSLLIIVQVALETMRQIEANLMMKQYGS